MDTVSTGDIASSAVWVNGLLAMFASQGVPAAGALEAAAIDPPRLQQRHERFSVDEINQLWRFAVGASGQETLGLDRELAGRFIDFEVAANAMGSGGSLWSALEGLGQYLQLTADPGAFTLEREHPDAWMVLTDGNEPWQPRQRIEHGMLAMVMVCQRATRRNLRPLAVDFVHAEPADVHRHRMAFPCPLRFDRPVNRMLFALEDLGLPVASSSPSLFVLEERVLETLLAGLGPARTSFRVSQEIVRRMHEGGSTSSIAASIGLGDAMLARQLRAERTSIDELADRVRRELAREYLGGTHYPLDSIPALLGLRDEAEFTAACRRWFFETPQDYRERYGPDQPFA